MRQTPKTFLVLSIIWKKKNQLKASKSSTSKMCILLFADKFSSVHSPLLQFVASNSCENPCSAFPHLVMISHKCPNAHYSKSCDCQSGVLFHFVVQENKNNINSNNFSPGTLASSHCPKTCTLGSLVTLNCP